MLAIMMALISGNGTKNIAAQARTNRSLNASQQNAVSPSSNIGFHSKFLTKDPRGLRAIAVW